MDKLGELKSKEAILRMISVKKKGGLVSLSVNLMHFLLVMCTLYTSYLTNFFFS